MSAFVLSAGGTGGHLFPAEALAHELIARGHTIHLATDKRAERFASSFPGELHVIPSATFASRNPVAMARAGWTLFKGLRAARQLLRTVRPSAVIGFGGYPTLPPLLAAVGVFPTMIHEANGVMGRANKLLASRVDAIAGGFLAIEGPHAAKMVRTGNPVRPAVTEASTVPYPERSADDLFRLLVFGGSQGAAYFAQVLPEAIERMDEGARRRLHVVHQVRGEDEAETRRRYGALGVEAETAPFFADLPKRIAEAHLVISRSGASTVSELSTIGRPSILVPYPHALDHDQAANAAALEAEGGATLVPQSDLTAERLATMLEAAIGEPERLGQMAGSAKLVGHADAATKLADLAEATAAKKE